MSTIGGVTCTFLRGAIPALKERVEKWTVPGIDGYGLALLGAGDSEFQLLGVLYSNNAGVELWAGSLYALQGTIVSATNDHGDAAANVFVERVEVCKKRTALGAGGITTRGECLLHCLLT